jgi:hypothetical protein
MSGGNFMKRRSSLVALLVACVAIAGPIAGQVQEERINADAYSKIRDEGLQRSQVMEIASYLTDVHGPRLTNSPNIRAAAQWTTRRMTEWGLTNVKLESWGPFGPGWSNERFYAGMVTPYPFPLIGYSKAWSPGTNRPVKADVVIAIVNTQADIEKYRGKLKGKIVMRVPAPVVVAQFPAAGSTLHGSTARGFPELAPTWRRTRRTTTGAPGCAPGPAWW